MCAQALSEHDALSQSEVDGYVTVAFSGHHSEIRMEVGAEVGGAGLIARVTRVSMLEVSSKDFIVLLHAKGLSKRAILLKHILRNALIPVITILGLRLGWVLGGAVTVEIVFARPGLGQLLITGLYRRDYPVVQGSLLLLAMGIMLGTFLADILYAYTDPRVRDQHR